MNTQEPPTYNLFGNSRSYSSDSVKDSQDSEQIYERIFLIHDGDHCRRFGCRFCSPKQTVEEHEREWRDKIALLHKGKNMRARLRREAKIEKLQRQQQSQQQTTQLAEQQDFRPLFMKELEEE